MNKTELFKECDRRGVGYMSNWTKPMLISRLKEEDEKDEVVYKPVEIWNDMHIKLNNLKGQYKMSEDSMSEIISRKKDFVSKELELNDEEIKFVFEVEIDKSIEDQKKDAKKGLQLYQIDKANEFLGLS